MKQRALLLKLHNMSSFETEEHESFDTTFRDDQNVKSVSPMVVKPNPIKASYEIKTTQLPSTVEFEAVEETQDILDDISGEWEIEDDDADNASSTDCSPIQRVTPLAAESTSSLYSFYFEDTTMKIGEDDNSVSFHDDVSFDYADFCFENIRENPETFWSASAMIMTQERLSSPAQVSLSSEGLSEIRGLYSL